MDKKLENVKLIKIVLMLLIVICHSIIFLKGSWYPYAKIEKVNAISYVVDWLGSFHVFAFALVSGYLFYFQKYEISAYPKYSVFIGKKVKRLIIPFLFLSLFWVIPVNWIIDGFNLERFVKILIGVRSEQLWFLLMLFFVFIIFYPLSDFFKKKSVLGVFISLACYLVGFIGAYFLPDVLQLFTALKFIPFFFLGFKMRQGWDEYISKIPFYVYLIIDLLIFGALVFMQTRDEMIFKLMSAGTGFVLNIIGSIMVWTTFQTIGNHCKWENSKILSFLSDKTFILYLLHHQIDYLVIHLFLGKVNIYIVLILNLLISLGLSILLSMLILKFNWSRFLFGEKPKKKLSQQCS